METLWIRLWKERKALRELGRDELDLMDVISVVEDWVKDNAPGHPDYLQSLLATLH